MQKHEWLHVPANTCAKMTTSALTIYDFIIFSDCLQQDWGSLDDESGIQQTDSIQILVWISTRTYPQVFPYHHLDWNSAQYMANNYFVRKQLNPDWTDNFVPDRFKPSRWTVLGVTIGDYQRAVRIHNSFAPMLQDASFNSSQLSGTLAISVTLRVKDTSTCQLLLVDEQTLSHRVNSGKIGHVKVHFEIQDVFQAIQNVYQAGSNISTVETTSGVRIRTDGVFVNDGVFQISALTRKQERQLPYWVGAAFIVSLPDLNELKFLSYPRTYMTAFGCTSHSWAQSVDANCNGFDAFFASDAITGSATVVRCEFFCTSFLCCKLSSPYFCAMHRGAAPTNLPASHPPGDCSLT